MDQSLIIMGAPYIGVATIAYFIGNHFGKNTKWGEILVHGDRHHIFVSGNTFKETKDKVMQLVHERDALGEQNFYHENRLNQMEELAFILTDLMHNQRVFDIFSQEELCEIFREARMFTKYKSEPKASIRDIEAFNQKLRDEVVAKLYPNHKTLEGSTSISARH